MIYFLTISEFIGRTHPLLVHLPIGILLLAVLFHFLSVNNRNENLKPAVKLILLVGAFSALVSCITGYLLSGSSQYDEALVLKHQWFGIGLTAVAFTAYYFYNKNIELVKWITPVMGLLIFITGHFGGSLTHGEGFLTKGIIGKNNSADVLLKPIPNVQEAVVYSDIVQPILQAKCYNCHSATKQKAALRLDEQEFILKGSENGKVLIAGNTNESELIQRVMLPVDDDDHMPPKSKSQLTIDQMELLKWWVNSGADFHKKVAETNQPENIKPFLASLQNGGQKPVATAIADIPQQEINKAPDSIIQKLKQLDVAVSPVSQSSNYLTVNFASIDSVTFRHMQLLKSISKQIAWLKLSSVKINDSEFSVIGNLTSLTRLYLNKTTAGDKALMHLKNLEQLQYLNLSETAVTANGLNSLSGLKKLKQLFLYQTNISPEGYNLLKKTLTGCIIDTGGYKVPFLQEDTMKVKAKPVKK